MNQIFENIISQLPGSAILVKDIQSKYLFISPSFIPLIGYKDQEQIVGISDYDLKCEASSFAAQFIEEDQAVITQKDLASFIYVMKYADGNTHYMLGCKKYFQDSRGKLAGVLGQLTFVLDSMLIHTINYLLQTDKKYSNHKTKLGTYKIGYIQHEKLRLTDMQSVCLFYLLRGKTTKEIGSFLHRSPRTIEVHMEQLKGKFNCPSKSLLIAKAIEMGYLYQIPSRFLSFLCP